MTSYSSLQQEKSSKAKQTQESQEESNQKGMGRILRGRDTRKNEKEKWMKKKRMNDEGTLGRPFKIIITNVLSLFCRCFPFCLSTRQVVTWDDDDDDDDDDDEEEEEEEEEDDPSTYMCSFSFDSFAVGRHEDARHQTQRAVAEDYEHKCKKKQKATTKESSSAG